MLIGFLDILDQAIVLGFISFWKVINHTIKFLDQGDCQQLNMIGGGDRYTKNGFFNSNHDSSTRGASVITAN